MASRSLTSLAALGLLAVAGCGDAAGNRPAAKVTTVAIDTQQRPTRVDALRADADVAAAAGDQMSARRFLDEALALEPRNQTLRDRLVQLGGTPPLITDTMLLAAESTRTRVPGPTIAALPTTPATNGASASGPAPRTLSPNVVAAIPPVPNPPEPAPSAAPAAKLTAPTRASVAAIPPAPNPPEPAVTAPAAKSAAPARVRVAAALPERRRVTRPSTMPATNVAVGGEVAVASRADTAPRARAAAEAPQTAELRPSTRTDAARANTPTVTAVSAELADLADARVAAPHVTTVAAAPQPAKHKRTWPWTRAQRWLVAKGIGAGGGAGVVVGAIIGNVPGALLVGSLGGGAVGFKKATKIGPADPYPDEKKVAEFEAKHRQQPAPTVVASADERREGAREAAADSTREGTRP